MIKIKQIKSCIGCPNGQKMTLKVLGLKKIGHVINKIDTPSIMGMVKKVKHLIKLY